MQVALDSLVFFVLLMVAVNPACAENAPAIAAKADDPKLTKAEIAKLVADLSSPKFAVRQSASQKLATGGAEVIGPVLEAGKTGNLEVATRAIQILEFNFLHGVLETSMKAQMALETLADRETVFASGPTIRVEANEILALNYLVREERALAAIRRLGGIVRYREGADWNYEDVTKDQPPEIVILTLQKWKGTSKDLEHIKRLDRLRQLYVIRKEVEEMKYVHAISEEDVAEIQRALPQVEVSWRGPAFLGVSGTDLLGRGCEINTVSPNQAAAKAGLQRNDLILQFDGQDVDSFEQLVRLIGRHDPGDKIPATALRGNQILEFEIILEGWK